MLKTEASAKKASVDDLIITRQDFERFRDYFYRKTGIYFEDGKRYFVDKRLVQRIQATGHDSFRSYFMSMRFQKSQKELQELINIMTVNESYFFREEYQFKCLVGPVLERVLQRKSFGQAIRIWSIPCSTGEEPYSIAIYLLEHWPPIEDVDVEIVASDIDTNTLSKAQKGIYGKRSVQNLPERILDAYFTLLDGGFFQISKDLRDSIDFRRVNICNLLDSKKFRNFDVIFCRNMLIYFDDASRRMAVEALFDAMNPGGFIFLGHSESMSRISSLFRVRRFQNTIVYQKPV